MSTPGLRILMTADAVGGVWQYATDLSAALAELGHDVSLAVLGPPPSPDQRRDAARHPGVNLIETGLSLDWLCDGSQPVVEAAEALARIAAERAVDVVHCNMPTLAGAAAFPAPVVAVTHGCVATWWQAAKAEPLAAQYRWHREMMAAGLNAAAAVVAPSASYAATIKRTYRLPALPRVVHNGRRVPQPAWAAKRPLEAALTVGRLWDPVKNAALLDRAAADLVHPFFAAGAQQGPHGEAVKLAHLLPLGQLDGAGLAALVASRPVFVSGATFEPFGLAVLEAAAAGCALVLSDIPTFRELWSEVAVFVDPTEPTDFTQAIAALLDDRERRERLGQAAARRAARFTPHAAAAAMASLYGELLDREAVAA